MPGGDSDFVLHKDPYDLRSFLMPERLIFAHHGSCNGFTRVSVGIREELSAFAGKSQGNELATVTVQRSQVFRSLLRTEGDTCVPVLPCHLKLWASYDPNRNVDVASLLSILEVAVFLQDQATVTSTSQQLAKVFRETWRRCMSSCPCNMLPLLPWPSQLYNQQTPTHALAALISDLQSLQPLSLHSVLSHLSPSDLLSCPPGLRARAIAVRAHLGVLDLTGSLAPVFTSREHMSRLREVPPATSPDLCIATTSAPDPSSLDLAPSDEYSRPSHHRQSQLRLSDDFHITSAPIHSPPHRQLRTQGSQSCSSNSRQHPANIKTLPRCPNPADDAATDSPISSIASPPHPDSPLTATAFNTCCSPWPPPPRAATKPPEPSAFLPATWLSQGSFSGPFLLPAAPSLALQRSDICYDVLNVLPPLLDSFARARMHLPRVVVTTGNSWPPPSDADMLAAVPFLAALQPLSPLSLELSGLPLYLSDAARWAPALAAMTQLTRLDLKLDSWKMLPARMLAASETAMRRQQQYCTPADQPSSTHHPSGPGSHSSVELEVDGHAQPGSYSLHYNAWFSAKAEAAAELAAGLRCLSHLRHLALHSCACEWTSLALRSLTCARHLSHLELHWIDNAHSAARHMVPAVAALISAGALSGVSTLLPAHASGVATDKSVGKTASTDRESLDAEAAEPQLQARDIAQGRAGLLHREGPHMHNAPPLATLILCQAPTTSKQFNPGSGCLYSPEPHVRHHGLFPAGEPAALLALLADTPRDALASLQKLSLGGLCVAVGELDALVAGVPRLTSLALPPTSTLAWLPKLTPLRQLQELAVEYVPETPAQHNSIGPADAVAGMHATAQAPQQMQLGAWACCARLRVLEIRRRCTLCRGQMYAVVAPQLSVLLGLTKLVWAAPLPGKAWAGDWPAVLADSLSSLTCLQHLEVSVGRDSGAAGTTRFADALGCLDGLTHLSMTVREVAGLAAALRRMPQLRTLSVKANIRQEHGSGVFTLLAALPHLSTLTSLRLAEKRPWSQLRTWRHKHAPRPPHTLAPSARSHTLSVPHGVASRQPSAGDRGRLTPARRAQQARSRMLQAVARQIGKIAAGGQLRVLRLDVPYMSDVVGTLGPHLARMHELQRLELAVVGEGYNSVGRGLWPHLLGLPLQEGVRLW
eukprot:jgi/Ulvmu1/3714/UM170_0020.1